MSVHVEGPGARDLNQGGGSTLEAACPPSSYGEAEFRNTVLNHVPLGVPGPAALRVGGVSAN